MAIFKRGKIYGVRIWHERRDIRKIIGYDRREAELAEIALKKEIASAKAAGQQWTGLETVRKARKPKTFAQATNDYLDERAHFKPSTLESYQSIFKTHLMPEFGNQSLRNISESQIAKFQARLNSKVSPARTNTIMQLLRSVFTVAARRGDISISPALAVRRTQEPKAKIEPLSEQELEMVLAKIDNHYLPLFITLAFTGAAQMNCWLCAGMILNGIKCKSVLVKV